MRGVVKWFNNEKKYGFVLYEYDKEAFVHFTEIQVEGYKTLKKGDEVEFELENTPKGYKAVRVKIITPKKKPAEQKKAGHAERNRPSGRPNGRQPYAYPRKTWTPPESQ